MTRSSAGLPRYALLGFTVDPGSLDDYLGFLATSIRNNTPCTVLYHNLHSLYAYFTDELLRRDYGDATVLVDGMPVIWLMRLCGIDVDRRQRLTYVDFILPMMRQAQANGWPVFHVGQDGETQQRALDVIRREVPGIDITGHHGYFDQSNDSAQSLAVIEAMNASDSKLVLVGFGTPKQEAWIAAHRERIDAPAVLACGACMEYVAGAVRTPPRWLGKLGLEWTFRLLENPRRFAFRYAIEPLLLGGILMRNALRNLPESLSNESLSNGSLSNSSRSTGSPSPQSQPPATREAGEP